MAEVIHATMLSQEDSQGEVYIAKRRNYSAIMLDVSILVQITPFN